MSKQSYLIDTNILIGLEDHHAVDPAYAKFHELASTYNVGIYVHEAAKDDIARDTNVERRVISLSKIAKYPEIKRRKGLTKADLVKDYGPLKKPNDVVDATLLHALEIGASDFLVTQDKGLHERAQKRSPNLARRVLFAGDAVELLIQTYEPKKVPIRCIDEVKANEIDIKDPFFESLREGYPEFNDWWQNKCVRQHRLCWVVYDGSNIAGLIVHKEEKAGDTDAITPAIKILKICTFKVAPESRGMKLGELLLKQVLWYAQANDYDLTYLTTYKEQVQLIDLLEYYGFRKTGKNSNGEHIYERGFSSAALTLKRNESPFDLVRENYPRFLFSAQTRGFGIPIKEDYHDTLFPDLVQTPQLASSTGVPRAGTITRPGNTIRKVYLCRAQSNLGLPGSLLFFYKGVSRNPPSQSITAIGILESMILASSKRELMRLTGGRSVYDEKDLVKWGATLDHPVKVINYLLAAYIDPPVSKDELKTMGIIGGHPQQSIYELRHDLMTKLIKRSKLNFAV